MRGREGSRVAAAAVHRATTRRRAARERATFDEMQPYSAAALEAAVAARESVTFYTRDKAQTLVAEVDLRLGMHTATPLYKDSRTIKGFVVKLPSRSGERLTGSQQRPILRIQQIGRAHV